MEIKYIWVKKHRILENLGINFHNSGRHRFEFSDDKLHLSPNPTSIINFSDNINGVTVLAGQNGSGKSSICEILLETTATYTNGSMGWNESFEGIVCYGDHIFHHESLSLENAQELSDNGYIIEVFKNSPFEEMKSEWLNTFANGGFIYYSNVIDWRSGLDAVNLVNISTQNLMSEDCLYGTHFSFETRFNKIPEHIHYRQTVSQMEAFLYGQGYRFTKLYLNFGKILDLKAPLAIKIKGSYSNNNKYLYTTDTAVNTQTFDEFEGYIFDTVYPRYKRNSEKEILETADSIIKEAICNLYKLNILRALSIKNKKEYNTTQIQNYLGGNIALSELFVHDSLALKLFEQHRKLVNLGEITSGYQISYLKYRAGSNGNWRFLAIEDLTLVMDSVDKEDVLNEFMQLEEVLLREDSGTLIRISNYTMLPLMSSGEISFYSIFARLYDTFQKYNYVYDKRQSIILFIDEAEVGFHPAWKKKFFKVLLLFLKQFDEYKFQIILTTHSPYLLSDLPADNVILLHKNRNGSTEILPKDQIKTFGANIHDLLTDSFFLRDGFIGDFAKDYINDLFAFLLPQSNKQNFSKEQARQIIEIIGEPILKSQLVQLYDLKFKESTELTFIDDEIARLQKIKSKFKDDTN